MQAFIHYFLVILLLILPFLFIYKINKNKGKYYKKLFFLYVILFWFLYLFMVLQTSYFLKEKMDFISSKYETNYFFKVEKNEDIKCPSEKYKLYIDRKKCIDNIRKNYSKEEKEYLNYLDSYYGDGGRNVFALFFGWLFGIIYFYIAQIFFIIYKKIHGFINK